MNLNEAKQILKQNGYILKESGNTTPMVCRQDDLELDFNGKSYRVDVTAYAEYYAWGGDRWNPPEDSFDIVSVDAFWYDLTDDDTPVEETKEMKDFLWDYLEKNQDLFEDDSEDPYDRADYEYKKQRDEDHINGID